MKKLSLFKKKSFLCVHCVWCYQIISFFQNVCFLFCIMIITTMHHRHFFIFLVRTHTIRCKDDKFLAEEIENRMAQEVCINTTPFGFETIFFIHFGLHNTLKRGFKLKNNLKIEPYKLFYFLFFAKNIFIFQKDLDAQQKTAFEMQDEVGSVVIH